MTSPSPAPLTEAERAAAEALALWHNAHSSTSRLAVAAFEGEARAVVAAVRPILAAEALRSTRKSITERKERLRADRSRLGQRFEGRCLGLEEATGMCTTAIKSLSLPASKETPMPEPTTTEEETTTCACFTDEAGCLDCRSCLSHHDLDDCDNWSEWTAKGWH